MLKSKFNINFFQSKVARRVTSLFLLSALVPLITTAFISKTYLTNVLIDQGYTRLQSEGKYYSMSLVDRLLYVKMKLTNIADKIADLPDKNIILKNYHSKEFISLTKERVNKTSLTNNSNKSDKNKIRIYSTSTNDGENHIFMTLRITQHNKNTASFLTAEINQNYLWNTSFESNSDFNICVINDRGGIFYCSSPIPIALNNRLNINDNKKLERWTANNETYMSASKLVFLKEKFNSSNWRIIVTQSEKDTLSAAATFNEQFPLIIILTILVVFFLSMTQIQRSLIPLKNLIKGTRHVANREFNNKVEVKGDDEFFELAQSFNSMTERLKRQFSTFSVLSEIDQLILSNTDSEHIYFTVLKYIQDIAPCDITSITVLDIDTPKYGKTYLSKKPQSIEQHTNRIILSNSDIKALRFSTKHNDLLRSTKKSHFLNPIKKFGVKHVSIFPVTVNDNLSAIITLGFINEPSLNNEDIEQLENIADRIAVALSAAERDKKLYHQSYFDSLTNLPNRQLISLRLEQEIMHCQRNNSSMAILFLDLDRFKQVNDTLGHTVGDELLKDVSIRLKKCIRQIDTVARLGGDEFTIMLTGSLKTRDIRKIADKIIKSFDKPFTINTHEIFIGTSIGISVFPDDGITVTELLKNADTAMYRVKEQGKGKHLFFEEKMNIEEVERANLEIDMRHALERNELSLQYQPIIELKTGNIVGAEALIRWHHPTHGLINTEKFISLAEETGIIKKVGEWVLTTACSQLKCWLDNNILIERMAINVSSRQFIQDNFENVIYSVLEETQIPAEKLELEITESVLMDEKIDKSNILNKLNNKNINLSIDDFGTGFSSLSYLKRFPLNTLKIDRSFMQDVPADIDAIAIVQSIIALAHTLNLKVIAEGIESNEQLLLLQENKCDYAQGYYFSPPLYASDFEEYYLKKNNILKFKH